MAAVWVMPAYQGGLPESAPGARQPPAQVARAPSPVPAEKQSGEAEPALPQIVVVEDIDCYSVIDLTAGAPVVSFARKDSSSPAFVTPVLPEPPRQPGRAGEEI
jgi:hypothetical protein